MNSALRLLKSCPKRSVISENTITHTNADISARRSLGGKRWTAPPSTPAAVEMATMRGMATPSGWPKLRISASSGESSMNTPRRSKLVIRTSSRARNTPEIRPAMAPAMRFRLPTSAGAKPSSLGGGAAAIQPKRNGIRYRKKRPRGSIGSISIRAWNVATMPTAATRIMVTPPPMPSCTALPRSTGGAGINWVSGGLDGAVVVVNAIRAPVRAAHRGCRWVGR